MATATIDAPQDQTDVALSRPETKTLFMSRRQDLRLVKVPRYPIRGASGQQVGEHPGQAVQFTEGVFRCPPEGEVVLEGGVIADAAEVHEWLVKHRMQGNIFEGFWKVDPVAPAPSEAEFQALLDAATDLDEDRLVELVAFERDGWGREALINAGEKSIARIREIKEKAQEAATAAAAASAAPPVPPTPAAPKE